jgi:hypothetical protein
VLAPKCSAAFTPFCPVTDGLTFGPDTLLVIGDHVADDPLRPQTPLSLGFNRFRLTFPVFGHDHPRDSPALVREEFWGRIRAWFPDFICQEPFCDDLNVSGLGLWRDDRAAPNAFDDTLQVLFPLDTLCVTPGPCGFNVKAALPTGSFGQYRFEIRGRDTNAIGGTCTEPSDLGPNPATFTRPTADFGRKTLLVTRQVVMRQLQEVRPYVLQKSGPAETRGARASRAVEPKAPRKGWWRR